METIVTTRIESETRCLTFGYWDMETEEFIPLDGMSDDELEETAKLLGCSPILLDAIQMLVGDIIENVGSDLEDIWQRLDDAGIE